MSTVSFELGIPVRGDRDRRECLGGDTVPTGIPTTGDLRLRGDRDRRKCLGGDTVGGAGWSLRAVRNAFRHWRGGVCGDGTR